MVYLRRTMSLNNLNNSGCPGQVATILILIIVTILIFILVTINLGILSTKATTVANAADSAVLYLGSTLASRAHYYWEQLEQSTKKCVNIFGWFLRLIGVILPPVGFIIGYMETGTIQGGIIGLVKGIGFLIACWLAIPSGGASLALYIALVVLAAAGLTYTGQVAAEMRGDVLTMIGNQLKALPEYESVAYGAMFYALKNVVDDPTKQNEVIDFNYDGDTTDKVTRFENTWYEFLEGRLAETVTATSIIEDFFGNYLAPFYERALDFLVKMDRDGIECSCPYLSAIDQGAGDYTCLCGTESMSGHCLSCGNHPPARGPLERFLYMLDKCPEDTFWEPGPTRKDLFNWYRKDCEECSGPVGYDDFDKMHFWYEDFIKYAKGLLQPDKCGVYQYKASDLDKTLRHREPVGVALKEVLTHDFVDDLYSPDPESTTDYYHKFQTFAGVMQDWQNKILGIRDRLPGCQLIESGVGVMERNDELEGAAPYCGAFEEDDSVWLPCNWNYAKTSLTGIYFPNPSCKLYPADKTTLSDEIATVQDFVVSKSSIENWIRNEYYSSPCGANCWLVANPGAAAGAPKVEIKVNSIGLVGNIHSRCKNTGLNPAGAKLSINYDYKYTCRCCVASVCSGSWVTNTDGTQSYVCSCSCNGESGCSSCVPHCTTTTNADGTTTTTCTGCSSNDSCCTTVDHTHSGTATKQIIIAAGDLYIPSLSVDAFLGVLQNFQNTVDGVSDTFATVDWDTEDEFEEFLKTIGDERQAIDDFLYGDLNPDTMDSLQDFYNHIAAVSYTRPADGRCCCAECYYPEQAGCMPCAKYDWTDSQGEHSVLVETGPFIFPYVEKKNHDRWWGHKECLEERKYQDLTGQETWVRITRTDPAEKPIRSSGKDLGLKWNPLFPSAPDKKATIRRLSRGNWSYDHVSIYDIKW